jgi:hypothetical protein
MGNATKFVLVLLLLAAMGPLVLFSLAAEPTPPKRVLLLMPFEASRLGSVVILRGIEQGLKASFSGPVDVATENVGPVPPEPKNYPARIGDWIAYKYGRLKFDAIVAITFPPIPSSQRPASSVLAGSFTPAGIDRRRTLGESRIDSSAARPGQQGGGSGSTTAIAMCWSPRQKTTRW